MIRELARVRMSKERIAKLIRQEIAYNPIWQFYQSTLALIWEYRLHSLAIVGMTILQEVAALWPVSLLGDFIDRLEGGEIGNIVWFFLLASITAPGLARANVMLRHKMFYESDMQKRLELVLHVSDLGKHTSPQDAGAAHTRALNAVSGITNATYHMLGSFTPVLIKLTLVSSRLLAYNRFLGLVYLASLIIPIIMTIIFNKRLRVLRDAEYSIMGEGSGVGIKTIAERENQEARNKLVEVLGVRKNVLQSLLYRSQSFLYLREAALVGSQFLVVFVALAIRNEVGITPGDFAKIIGYTAQVAGAFITAASCLDNVVSYSRAYHVYAIGCR